MTTLKRNLVIYHANCADGFGAAFAMWLKLEDTADYVPLQYGYKPHELPDVKGRKVWIVDFSLPLEDMERVINEAAHIKWYDHHKTAFEMWGVTSQHVNVTLKKRIILDNDRSGALITYEEEDPDPIFIHQFLFDLLDDYDRWQFKLLDTKAFNKGLWSLTPWSFEQWDQLDVAKTIVRGQVLLEQHEKHVEQIIKSSARECAIALPNTVTPIPGMAANCPAFFSSDVGHHLAVNSGTYGLTFSIGHDPLEKIKCSLRSNGDYDVSAIAKQFGGGGHKNAAGFTATVFDILRWIA